MSGRSFRKQIRSAVCRNLQRMMKERKLNQRELAEVLGLPPGQVSHYVRGTRCPLMDTLGRMAYLLNVSVEEFLKK